MRGQRPSKNLSRLHLSLAGFHVDNTFEFHIRHSNSGTGESVYEDSVCQGKHAVQVCKFAYERLIIPVRCQRINKFNREDRYGEEIAG